MGVTFFSGSACQMVEKALHLYQTGTTACFDADSCDRFCTMALKRIQAELKKGVDNGRKRSWSVLFDVDQVTAGKNRATMARNCRCRSALSCLLPRRNGKARFSFLQ